MNIREEAWTTDLHHVIAAGKKFEDKHKPGEKIFIFRTNLVVDQVNWMQNYFLNGSCS